MSRLKQYVFGLLGVVSIKEPVTTIQRVSTDERTAVYWENRVGFPEEFRLYKMTHHIPLKRRYFLQEKREFWNRMK